MSLKLYKEQQNAFNLIEKIIKGAIAQGIPLNISAIILQVTLAYPISSKAVHKRLELYAQSDPRISINKDEMTFDE